MMGASAPSFGKVVITGGGGALGRAVVERVLQSATHCTVVSRSAADLRALPFDDRVEACALDVCDEAAVQAFYAKHERVDASIHLVGGFTAAPFTETKLSDFERMLRVNAVSAFLCCREAAKRMRAQSGGRIVNVVARPVLEPIGGMVAYAAAKAAVASLTQCLAREVRAEGVLVNAVVPSIIDTPANRAALSGADRDDWPTPEQVAEAIAFLASPQNTLTSGVLLPVYGRS